jgi:hypothetical protein
VCDFFDSRLLQPISNAERRAHPVFCHSCCS